MNLRSCCKICGEPLGVLNSKIEGEFRVRFFGCRGCGWRPDDNKQIVPIEYAPPRRRRMKRRQISRR